MQITLFASVVNHETSVRASWDAGTAPEIYPGSACTVPPDTSVSLFTVLQHDDVGALSHSRLSFWQLWLENLVQTLMCIHFCLFSLFFPGPPKHSKVEDTAGHGGTWKPRAHIPGKHERYPVFLCWAESDIIRQRVKKHVSQVILNISWHQRLQNMSTRFHPQLFKIVQRGQWP